MPPPSVDVTILSVQDVDFMNYLSNVMRNGVVENTSMALATQML